MAPYRRSLTDFGYQRVLLQCRLKTHKMMPSIASRTINQPNDRNGILMTNGAETSRRDFFDPTHVRTAAQPRAPIPCPPDNYSIYHDMRIASDDNLPHLCVHHVFDALPNCLRPVPFIHRKAATARRQPNSRRHPAAALKTADRRTNSRSWQVIRRLQDPPLDSGGLVPPSAPGPQLCVAIKANPYDDDSNIAVQANAITCEHYIHRPV